MPLPSDIRAVILDMDGVLWKDTQPIGNPSATIEAFQSAGIKIAYATNNSSKTADQYAVKLKSVGIKASPDQIITSGMAVSLLLLQRFPMGGPVYAIGEAGFIQTLEDHGFHHTEEDVLAVVSGFDRQLTYEKLTRAALLIRSGAAFYGTNPDRSFPTPMGLAPGAGAIQAAIEAATDSKPIIAGKPLPTMMQFALQRLGTQPQDTMVVGDRLETDILGGQNANCRTALVLTGVSTRKDLGTWHPQPDLVVDSLSDLMP